MFPSILTAAIAFISTNIDDIFVLMLFFAQAQNAADRRRITAGQYLGIGLLTALSLTGARALQLVPRRFIGILGLIPIALGIREWLEWRKSCNSQPDSPEATPQSASILSVALVTIANGADNIGVYVPLFAGYSAGHMLLAVAVFALLTALWCLLGMRLAALPALKNGIRQYRHIIVPMVFICLGLWIILENCLP